jgi:hypothetical protein
VTVGARYAFTHGMDRAFLYAVPVAALAFLLSFLLRELRLKDGSEEADTAPEAARAEPSFV